jgi:recombinational DNA repair ATPase RecF
MSMYQKVSEFQRRFLNQLTQSQSLAAVPSRLVQNSAVLSAQRSSRFEALGNTRAQAILSKVTQSGATDSTVQTTFSFAETAFEASLKQ